MKNLQSKKFSAFIFSALMFSVSAYAQIIYTDINPDISKTRSSVTSANMILTTEETIDVNNDGTPDLKFTLTSKRIRRPSWGPNPVPGPGGNPPVNPFLTGIINGNVSVTPLNGSAILSGASGNPGKLNLNESISAGALWSATANQILVSKSSNIANPLGNWNAATDGFLGLRLIAAGKTHYCWIRLSAEAFSSGPNAANLVLKDFAYNFRRNKSILAGQKTTLESTNASLESALRTATSMDEDISSILSPSLYPNPAIDKFTVDLGSLNEKADITIFDLKGKIVYSTTETDLQRLEVSTSSFEKGIYIVKIQSEEFAGMKKLMVTK